MSASQKMVRFGILLSIFVLCVAAVLWRQSVIRQARTVPIVSVLSEWERTGKPAELFVLRREDVPVYTKFTVLRKASNVYEGEISGNVFEKIQSGQEAEVSDGGMVYKGKVEIASPLPTEGTGLYNIRVLFADGLPPRINMPVCAVHTDTIKGALRAPADVVITEGDRYFLWTVDRDGSAHKKAITIKSKNGYGFIIDSGVEEGSLLVARGFTNFKEGDRVQVLNPECCPGGADHSGVVMIRPRSAQNEGGRS